MDNLWTSSEKGARSSPTHCGRSWAQIGMHPGFQVSSFCKENPKWRTKIYTRLTRVSQWRSFQQFYWLILEFLQEWYQYSCVVFSHPFFGFNWGQSYSDRLVRPQICTKMLSRNLTFLVQFAYFASDQNFRQLPVANRTLHFSKFPIRVIYPNFQKFLPGTFLSIKLCSQNFQNFRLNNSHLRNSTVLALSGNFPGNFPYHLPPFSNFRKFRCII